MTTPNSGIEAPHEHEHAHYAVWRIALLGTNNEQVPASAAQVQQAAAHLTALIHNIVTARLAGIVPTKPAPTYGDKAGTSADTSNSYNATSTLTDAELRGVYGDAAGYNVWLNFPGLRAVADAAVRHWIAEHGA